MRDYDEALMNMDLLAQTHRQSINLKQDNTPVVGTDHRPVSRPGNPFVSNVPTRVVYSHRRDSQSQTFRSPLSRSRSDAFDGSTSSFPIDLSQHVMSSSVASLHAFELLRLRTVAEAYHQRHGQR